MKLWKVSWFAEPMRVIGVVVVLALPKTSRNVRNCGSGASAGDFSESVVVGTFLDPVRELCERRGVGAEVLDQQPRLVLVLRRLRDADDAAGDVAGAFQLGVVVGDRDASA